MGRKGFVAFVVLTIVANAGALAHAQNKSAKDVIANVARAMGTANLKSVQYSATGFYFWLGQGYKTSDPWPQFTLNNYLRTLDYENGASEEKFSWTESATDFDNKKRGGGLTPLKGEGGSQDGFLSGNYAWNLAANGNANPQSTVLVEERQVRLMITPHGWIKAAMTANPTMRSENVNGKKMTVVSFTLKGKYKIDGYVDDQKMLEKVEAWIPQPILGDMPVEATYSDYKDFSGVKFPTKIVQKEGGFPVWDLTVSNVVSNAPVKILVPETARNPAPPLRVVSQPLADGVWILRAGSQSLAVEFKDYVAIIDGAGNEERSQGVFEETKKLVPNKPIKYVINTHHHLDHSGGLRTFVARGVTIITAEENKPYFEKIFKLPHALDPDELAKNAKQARFVTFKDKYVLTDGDQSIELYRLQDYSYADHQNSHAPDMLIAYLPKEKALMEADFFNPGPLPRALTLLGSAEALQDNIRRRNLDVRQFVAIHGNGVTPLVDLQKTIDSERAQLEKIAKDSGSAALQ